MSNYLDFLTRAFGSVGSLSTSSFSSKAWSIAAEDAKIYNFLEWARGTEIGTLRVASRRVAAFFGVHHCVILVGAIKREGVPLYLVFEWMDDGYHRYATDKIHPDAHWCQDLGIFSVDDILGAAVKANGKDYSISSYNCNHWTEAVAWFLGVKLTVRWSCTCVLFWKDNSTSVQFQMSV